MKNIFKLAILSLFAPEFWRRMPEDKGGEYYAQATTFSHWRETVKSEKVVTGRQNAYIQARWDALMLDWTTDNYGGELGIGWKVISVEKAKESYDSI